MGGMAYLTVRCDVEDAADEAVGVARAGNPVTVGLPIHLQAYA